MLVTLCPERQEDYRACFGKPRSGLPKWKCPPGGDGPLAGRKLSEKGFCEDHVFLASFIQESDKSPVTQAPNSTYVGWRLQGSCGALGSQQQLVGGWPSTVSQAFISHPVQL